MKKQIPEVLDRIADTVLAYRPKEKVEATKVRQKRKAKGDHQIQTTIEEYLRDSLPPLYMDCEISQ